MAVVTNPSIDAKTRGIILHIVEKIKSQGVFDRFRRDCLEELDSKEPYRQLKQRVESHVATFLSKQICSPSLPKNQLRNSLRANISQSEVLSKGVDRLLEEVLAEKSGSFYNEIEGLVHDYLLSIGHYSRRESKQQKSEISKLTDKEIDDFIKEETSKLLEAEGEKLKESFGSKFEPTVSSESLGVNEESITGLAANEGEHASTVDEVLDDTDNTLKIDDISQSTTDENDGLESAESVMEVETSITNEGCISDEEKTVLPENTQHVLATDNGQETDSGQDLQMDVKPEIAEDATEFLPKEVKPVSPEIIKPVLSPDSKPEDRMPVLPRDISENPTMENESNTNQVLPKNTIPVLEKPTEQALPNSSDGKPALLKVAELALPKDSYGKPVSPNDTSTETSVTKCTSSKLVLPKDALPKETSTKLVASEDSKPVLPKETSTKQVLTKDVKAVLSKEVSKTKPSEKDAKVKIKHNLPKESKSKPVLQKDAEPVLPRVTTKPVLPKDAEPVLPKVTKPVLLKDAEPVFPKVTKPVLPKDTEPVLPRVIKPVLPKDAEPVLPRVTKPVLQKDAEPVLPRVTKKVLPKDVKPVLAKESKPKATKPKIKREPEKTTEAAQMSTDEDSDEEKRPKMAGLSCLKPNLPEGKPGQNKEPDIELSDSDITVSSVHTSDLSSLDDSLSDLEFEEYKAMTKKSKSLKTGEVCDRKSSPQKLKVTSSSKTTNELATSDVDDEDLTDSDFGKSRPVSRKRFRPISSEAGSDCSSELSLAEGQKDAMPKRRSARVASKDAAKPEPKEEEVPIKEQEDQNESEESRRRVRRKRKAIMDEQRKQVEEGIGPKDEQEQKITSDSNESEEIRQSKRSRRTIRPTRCYSPSENN